MDRKDNNMQEEERRRKRLIRIIIISTVLFVTIPIIIFIIVGSTTEPGIDTSRPDEDIPTIDSHGVAMSFESRDQLDRYFGYVLTGKILDTISLEVLKESEINSAPLPNDPMGDPKYTYNVVLDEESFDRAPDQPSSTFTFNVYVSDGRTYQIYSFSDDTLLSAEIHLAILIKRTDRPNRINPAFIYYREAGVLPSLTQWAQNIDPNSKIVLQERF